MRADVSVGGSPPLFTSLIIIMLTDILRFTINGDFSDVDTWSTAVAFSKHNPYWEVEQVFNRMGWVCPALHTDKKFPKFWWIISSSHAQQLLYI
jgi:hypothetical protein